MNIEVIGLITLLLGTVSLFLGPNFAFFAYIPMTLLGSAGAVLLGGAGTIQPAHLMLGFVAVCVFSRPERLAAPLHSVTFPREGFWLVLFVGYGVFSAYFLPRVFAGVTGINAIGSTDYGPSLLLVPLGPTSGNATQSVYLTADFACFFTTLAYASTPRGFRTVAGAVVAYCAVNLLFAALDIATAATNTGQLLGFIRNADYQLHIEESVVGLRRITGSFTEASSFSYATVGSLGFTTRLWLAGRWPWATLAMSLTSLVLLALSTSSTAYVATPILLVVLYVGSFGRAIRGSAVPATFVFLVFAPLATAFAAVTVALEPAATQALSSYLDVVLLDKSTSQSGLERAQWNATALRNFFDTYGMGGGLGSIRASSFPLAVLSNVGAFGAAAFAGFLVGVLSHRRESGAGTFASDIRAATTTACGGLLIAATVSGALVDLGLLFYVLAALACASPAVAVPAKPSTVVPVRAQTRSALNPVRQ